MQPVAIHQELGSRRSTDASLAGTVAGSPPDHQAPSKQVYSVNKEKVYRLCTTKEAQAYVKHASKGDEAPLVPRVFLRARALGASPQASELLSKVRAANLLARLLTFELTLRPRTHPPRVCGVASSPGVRVARAVVGIN